MKPLNLLVALPTLAAMLAATSGCMSTADANTHRVAGGAVTRFHQLDTNHDGKVTFAEFDAGFAGTVFSQYNRDGNGSITQTEWDMVEQANTNKSISSFKLLDRNHDGKLTTDELTHGKQRNLVVRRLFNRSTRTMTASSPRMRPAPSASSVPATATRRTTHNGRALCRGGFRGSFFYHPARGGWVVDSDERNLAGCRRGVAGSDCPGMVLRDAGIADLPLALSGKG